MSRARRDSRRTGHLVAKPAVAGPGGALPRFRCAVERLAPYRVAMPAHRRKLNQNESAAELPAPLKRRIVQRLARAAWRRYPDYPPTRLQDAIARREGLPAAAVLVGHGSNELLYAAALATLERGGAMLLPAPSYPVARLAAGLAGARTVAVPLGPRFEYEPGRIVAAVRRHRPRLVFLPSPNNPTGGALDPEQADWIAARCRALLVVDEAYHEFSSLSLRPLLRRHRHLLLLRTLSKAYRIAALRVGYLLGDEQALRRVEVAKPPHSIDLLGQIAGEAILEEPSFIAGEVRRVTKARDLMFEKISALAGLEVFPSQANFLLVRAGDAAALHATLLAAGILVRPVGLGPAAPESLRGCLRISIGTDADNRAVLRLLTRHAAASAAPAPATRGRRR